MYRRNEGKKKVKIGAYKGLIRTLPLFFWRFAVIFLQDFISNCVYTANLEDHCIFILVELQCNQSFRYFVTGIEFWVDNWYKLLNFFSFLVFAAANIFFRSFLAALLAQYR